jgi:hypothetical protein
VAGLERSRKPAPVPAPIEEPVQVIK